MVRRVQTTARHKIVPERGAIRSAKPRDRDPVPRGDTDFTGEPFAAIAYGGDLCFVAGHGQHCRNGYAAGCDCRLRQFAGDRAVQTDVLGERQLAAASYAPAIDEAAFVHGFAHRGTAEYDGFGHHQRGAGRQIDVNAARKTRTIEQNSLLRQPETPAARPRHRSQARTAASAPVDR